MDLRRIEAMYYPSRSQTENRHHQTAVWSHPSSMQDSYSSSHYSHNDDTTTTSLDDDDDEHDYMDDDNDMLLLHTDTTTEAAAAVAASELEIVIPGTFVVLQGNMGDGLSNTIDTVPKLTATTMTTRRYATATATTVTATGTTNENRLRSSSSSIINQRQRTTVLTEQDEEDSDIAMVNDVHHHASETDDDEEDFHHVTSHSVVPPSPAPLTPPPPPLGRLATSTANNPYATRGMGAVSTVAAAAVAAAASAGDAVSDDASAYVVVSDNHQQQQQPQQPTLHPDEQIAMDEWIRDCQQSETQHRQEWKESLLQTIPPSHNSSSSSSSLASTPHSAMLDHVMITTEHHDLWWQYNSNPPTDHQNQVAILRDVPTKLRSGVVLRVVIGQLSPGTTVVAKEIVHLDSKTLQRIPVVPTRTDRSSRCCVYPRGQKGIIQMVQVETPEGRTGYACLSLDGYPLLAPGEPSLYVDPSVWIWRVTCPAGAYVRGGLDLSTQHIATLPFGSLVRVTRRCINNQGLSRLRTHGTVQLSAGIGAAVVQRGVDGWCSELLNPLSGQRGVIAQPLPFPVPAIYRVTLPLG
jgi:hypothetical protein